MPRPIEQREVRLSAPHRLKPIRGAKPGKAAPFSIEANVTTAEHAQPPGCEEVTAALSAYVNAVALDLGKIGTPDAVEAMNALAAAMKALADAYRLSAAVLNDGLPVAH